MCTDQKSLQKIMECSVSETRTDILALLLQCNKSFIYFAAKKYT